MKEHYHIFSSGEDYFILDTRLIVLAEVSSTQATVFEHINKDDTEISQRYHMNLAEVQEAKQVFIECIAAGLFRSDLEDPILNTESETGYISLTPVHMCNYRCEYCFAQHGDNYHDVEKTTDLKRIDDALTYAFYNIFKNKKNIKVDLVGGGENLLNPNAVKHILEKVKELGESTKKNYNVFLVTNGSMMSKEILDVIDRNYLNLGISIDGNQQNHDAVRRNVNGQGTYGNILNTIQYIQDNAKNRNLKDIWGMAVITAQTTSLIDMIENFQSIGIRSVQMKLVRIACESRLSIHGDRLEHVKKLYRDFTTYLKSKLCMNDMIQLKMILNDNDYFGKIVKRILLQKITMTRCHAGTLKVSIVANGNIYPCDSFVGNEQFILGNIYEKESPFCSEFNGLSIEQRTKCKECWAKYLCGGDCPHNSYVNNGTILEPDSEFCELQKYMIHLALELVNFISKKDKTATELINFVTARERLNKFNR